MTLWQAHLPGYQLWRRQTFMYHLFWLDICQCLLRLFPDVFESRDTLLHRFGQFLTPALSIRESIDNSHFSQLVMPEASSQDPQLLARLDPTLNCRADCVCTVCLIRCLYGLPNKLLSIIAPYLISGYSDLQRIFQSSGRLGT